MMWATNASSSAQLGRAEDVGDVGDAAADGTSTLYQVFYDGACPICRREMLALQRRAQKSPQLASRVNFCDFTQPEFQPESYGLTMAELMAELHVYDLKRGQFLVGMAALRALYRSLGLGGLVNWTGLPVVKPGCDLAYKVFAKFRPRLGSRRCHEESCSSS